MFLRYLGVGTTTPSQKLDVNGTLALAGNNFAVHSGNYNILYDAAGNQSLFLGNGSDPQNYYRNTNHLFQNIGGTIQYMNISQFGVTIGGNNGTPLATLDVRPDSGTLAVASISGQTSFASLVVDNSGVGDIFTASAGGVPHFVISNIGAVTDSNYTTNSGLLYTDSTGLFKQVVTPTGGASNCLSASFTWVVCSGGSGGTNSWSQTNGALYPGNSTVDLLIGGVSTSSAAFHVYGGANSHGTNPVASIAANTSFAALVVDNTGSGDLFAASSSGKTRFTVRQNGVVQIGDNNNGLTFDYINGGPTYTGTARPTKQILLSAEYAGSVLTASGSATTNGTMTSSASPSATIGNIAYENYFQWVSSQSSLNDYTIAVKVTLPPDFSSWAPGGSAMQIAYNTNLKDNTSNKLDVYIYNQTPSANNPAGVPVVQRLGLASTADQTWTTLNLSPNDFAGTSIWNTASQSAVIYLKLYSKNNLYTQVGDIILNYLSKF